MWFPYSPSKKNHPCLRFAGSPHERTSRRALVSPVPPSRISLLSPSQISRRAHGGLLLKVLAAWREARRAERSAILAAHGASPGRRRKRPGGGPSLRRTLRPSSSSGFSRSCSLSLLLHGLERGPSRDEAPRSGARCGARDARPRAERGASGARTRGAPRASPSSASSRHSLSPSCRPSRTRTSWTRSRPPPSSHPSRSSSRARPGRARGPQAPRRVALMAAGAATGALAALQRWAGLFRLPLRPRSPGFFAAGLIGNAGDVGMALVIPAVLLFARAAEPRRESADESAAAALGLSRRSSGSSRPSRSRRRSRSAGAPRSFVALDFRRRSLALSALVAAAFLAIATGAGRRVLVKLDELRRGDLASATTQRDIGLLAGARDAPRAAASRSRARERSRIASSPRGSRPRSARGAISCTGAARRTSTTRTASPSRSLPRPEARRALAAVAAACALLAGLLGRRKGSSTTGGPSSVDALFADSVRRRAALSRGLSASDRRRFRAGRLFRRAWRFGGSKATKRSRMSPRAAAGSSSRRSRFSSSRLPPRGRSRLSLRPTARICCAKRPPPPRRPHPRRPSFSRRRTSGSAQPSPSGRARPRRFSHGARSQSLRGEREVAYALYARSVRLEERAESDLNLGRAAAALGTGAGGAGALRTLRSGSSRGSSTRSRPASATRSPPPSPRPRRASRAAERSRPRRRTEVSPEAGRLNPPCNARVRKNSSDRRHVRCGFEPVGRR